MYNTNKVWNPVIVCEHNIKHKFWTYINRTILSHCCTLWYRWTAVYYDVDAVHEVEKHCHLYIISIMYNGYCKSEESLPPFFIESNPKKVQKDSLCDYFLRISSHRVLEIAKRIYVIKYINIQKLTLTSYTTVIDNKLYLIQWWKWNDKNTSGNFSILSWNYTLWQVHDSDCCQNQIHSFCSICYLFKENISIHFYFQFRTDSDFMIAFYDFLKGFLVGMTILQIRWYN